MREHARDFVASNVSRCLMLAIFLSSLYAERQVFVMCLSMLSVSVKVIPRLRACLEKGMSVWPTVIDEGVESGIFFLLE